MNDAFQSGKDSAYELRSGNRHLQGTNIQAIHFGSEYIKALGAKIWDLNSSEDKSIKISYDFQEKDKELDSQEFPLSPLQDLYWQSWFHKLTFTFLPSPTTC